jgi:hypothetical protein
MKAKVQCLGVQLLYPYGEGSGLFQLLRRYIISAEDGRIDIIEECDEPLISDGEYDFPEETLNKIFNSVPEPVLREDEW